MAVPEPVPEPELPRFHSDAELSLELPPALREWVLRAAQSGGSAAASAAVTPMFHSSSQSGSGEAREPERRGRWGEIHGVASASGSDDEPLAPSSS